MTRHRYTRCLHCSVVFVYQSSGQKVNWYKNQSDSSTYCKDCWAIICEALSSIPRRCEQFFVEVKTEAEKEAVLAKEIHDKENPVRLFGSKTGPIIREIGSSLYKMDGAKIVASMHPVVTRMDRVKYFIERWSDGSKPVKIVKTMERDLKTGEERQWEEY